MNNDQNDFDAARDRKAQLEDALSRRRVDVELEAVQSSATMAAVGKAMRLSATLVVSVLVGGALGYGLGALIGFEVWFVLGGLIFGMAAGLRDAVRLAVQMQQDALALQEGSGADESERGD